MSEYSPPNWTEPLPIYNPINFQVAQATNGGGGGSGTYLNFPVAQGSQTMKSTLVNGSFQVSGGQSVNMGANIVQNAGTPVNPTDLATKAYVDLNAGTQNLQSVLTAGNTTGNFQINHSANYGDIYNGSGANWVVACDPVQFSSTATNDLYLASNATDNFVRMGSYTGSTFTENARIGDLATGEKRAIFAGTLTAVCIEDATGSKGTANQVLSAGTSGGSLKWTASGGGGAGTLDATLALGNTATGTYANINLTDTAVGGSANPIMTLSNTEATTGAVVVDLYKNRTGATSDIVGALNFYGKDNAGNKTQYGGIESVITSAGGGGGVDGSLDFYSCVNGVKSQVFRLNGADNENNSFRPLDMNGNNITASSGAMTITTASSSGTGTLSLLSKAGATASMTAGGSLQLNASAGSISSVGSSGILSTATSGNNALTANIGNIVLTASSGANNQTSNSLSITSSTTGQFNIPAEFHTGVITSSYSTQVYQTKYQPILSTTPHILPVAEFQRDGQDIMLINSKGDGNNELTTIATPNFTITQFKWIPSLSSYIAGGYNNVSLRPEVRCGTTLADILTDTTSGSFTYIAFNQSTNPSGYIWDMCYDATLFPTSIAIGGNFTATTSDVYNVGGSTFPSSVSNFLVIDIASTIIAPTNMNDPAQNPYTDIYGTNSAVLTISAYANSIGAGGNVYLIGGQFTALNSNGGTNLPAGFCAAFIPAGGFTPLNFKWVVLFDANNIVKSISTFGSNVLVGGSFSAINVGGASGGNPRLAWCDNLTSGSFAAVGNGTPTPFTPPTDITAGSGTLLNTSNEAYVACADTSLPDKYPVYVCDMGNLGSVVPSLYKADFPAQITGMGYDPFGSPIKLGFITGYDFNPSGSPLNSFVWDVQTPQFLDLNGALGLQNISYETSSGNKPYFSVNSSTSNNPPKQISYFNENGAGDILITTTIALPFFNPNSPLNKYTKLTLANRANFAMGTIVGFGTDDVRIFIYAQTGATFSN